MRKPILLSTLGFALVAGVSAAHAQTVVAQGPVVTVPAPAVVAETAPVETVETVRTVRSTIVPRRRFVRRHHYSRVRTVTTRTIVRERVVPTVTPAVAAITEPGYTEVVSGPPPAPLYDVVAAPPPAPLYDVVAAPPPAPLYDVVRTPPPAPLYDVVATPPAPVPGVVDQGIAVPSYRYVYEPNRILVIDPRTNIAVRAIPR